MIKYKIGNKTEIKGQEPASAIRAARGAAADGGDGWRQ